MSSIIMPSGITRARVTSCCSLVIRISATSRSLFNAGSDWVGSCAITIKRRRDRTPKGSIPELRFCAMRLGNRGKRGSRFAARRPNSALRQARSPCGVLALPPFQYFGHTGPFGGRTGHDVMPAASPVLVLPYVGEAIGGDHKVAPHGKLKITIPDKLD